MAIYVPYLGGEVIYVPFVHSKHVIARGHCGGSYSIEGAGRAPQRNYDDNDNYHGDKALLRSGGESLSKLGRQGRSVIPRIPEGETQGLRGIPQGKNYR